MATRPWRTNRGTAWISAWEPGAATVAVRGAPKYVAAAWIRRLWAVMSGSRVQASRLISGTGQGHGLMPVDRSIHPSAGRPKGWAAASRPPPWSRMGEWGAALVPALMIDAAPGGP